MSTPLLTTKLYIPPAQPGLVSRPRLVERLCLRGHVAGKHFVQAAALERRLAGLQETCRDVGEALALEYFHSAPWVAWTDAGRQGSLVIEEGEI